MRKPFHFKVSTGLKSIIGRDLIADDFIAIFELVKNAYDARAKSVEIIFENLNNSGAKITIRDNGKGMDANDIENKWLFVAYSAKKEGKEDDYIEKIYQHRTYAGAKGIGRFSCDKIGAKLRLISVKEQQPDKAHIVEIDWSDFERDLTEEFESIDIPYSVKKSAQFSLKKGTIIEIYNLRDAWDREKILKLKDSLAKLINPNKGKGDPGFNIEIIAEDEKEGDAEILERIEDEILDEDEIQQLLKEIVNGNVENFIFETLNLKTTKIFSSIDKTGGTIRTELYDGGTRVYTMEEENYFTFLRDIQFTIYYLNRSAKSTFARRMGVSSVNYGHMFLYKNGFRIYPYGEPGEDPLKIDVRKSQGQRRYLGTREIIGQIEITSANDDFKESSSRGDGFIKTTAYEELKLCFLEVLKKLEKYVVDVQQWGLSIEDSNSPETKSRAVSLLAKITGASNIISFDIPDNFQEILYVSQLESAESLVNNLNKIALSTSNNELIDNAKKAKLIFKELQDARIEAENRAVQEQKKAELATKELQEKVSENLFLKSVKSQDFDEIISFLHHIGISAGIIDNYLTGIHNKLRRGVQIPADTLLRIIEIAVFENKKIQNIAKFATKANFKLYTDAIDINLGEYLKEYIENIVDLATGDNIKVRFENNVKQKIIKKFRPIELNILIDNLLSNSKKAGATVFTVKLENRNGQVEIIVEDNGRGIEKSKVVNIFNYGYTTNTEGSGIGLYHVHEIVNRLNGAIEVSSKLNKGTTFKITL
jgi:signal transduction histidine kinase